jgi:Fe-S-cluster containining protein
VDFTYPNNLLFDCSKCGLCCGDTKQKTRHILLLESKDKTPSCFEIKKPKVGKCFFLKDNQCSIYRLRPIICRFYPFELKFDPDKGIHVFDFTLECPGISKGKIMTLKDFEELFALAKERLC